MALDSIGVAIRVTTPGVPVNALSFAPVAPRSPAVHGVMFQALPTNTGLVYVGLRGMDKATFVKCLAFLGVPASGATPATFSAAMTIAPNGLGLQAFYVDAAVANDGVILTYLVT